MLGKRLNETRKLKGFTAQQMADYLSITLSSYRMYESDKRRPSFESLIRISDKLDVTIDYLLGRDDFLKSL